MTLRLGDEAPDFTQESAAGTINTTTLQCHDCARKCASQCARVCVVKGHPPRYLRSNGEDGFRQAAVQREATGVATG